MFRVWLLFYVICFIKTGCFNVCSTVALEVVFNNQQIRQRMSGYLEVDETAWWNFWSVWSVKFDLWSFVDPWSFQKVIFWSLIFDPSWRVDPQWSLICWSAEFTILDQFSKWSFDLESLICGVQNFLILVRRKPSLDKSLTAKHRNQDRGKPRDFLHSIRYGANGSGRSLNNAYW